jgi:hypothetical protein
MPWEPREPERNPAKAELTAEFLEKLEAFPGIQRVAAAAISVIAKLKGIHDTPVPDDVPNPPGAWKFAAIGDYGAGTTEQAKVAANILRAKPELLITVGDNVYPTGRWTDYARHFDPPQFMGTLARSVPFMPALGNHDMYRDDLRPYFGHFPYLQGRPYYAFTHKNAQFVALDGDQDLRVGSAQYRWLEHELKTSKSKWKIVYLHYPMYGNNLEFPEITRAVQPLLAKYHVQLLVAGHEHNYTRAFPQSGVTHILTGGGGQQVYAFTQKAPAHIAHRVAKPNHVEVSVGADTMVVRAIDDDGNRIDTVQIPATWGAAQAQQGAAHVRHRRRHRRPARRAAGPAARAGAAAGH